MQTDFRHERTAHINLMLEHSFMKYILGILEYLKGILDFVKNRS